MKRIANGVRLGLGWIALLLAGVAHADSLSATFTQTHLGPAPAPGGQVSLSLNGDGTIGGTVSSFNGVIYGFAFDSLVQIPASNFSDAGYGTSSWNTAFGSFRSGIYDFDTPSSSVSFTLGTAGQFDSVQDLLGGPNTAWDFFLYTSESGRSLQWSTNAQVVTPVPEPETYAMWLLGAGVLWGVARRRERALSLAPSQAGEAAGEKG